MTRVRYRCISLVAIYDDMVDVRMCEKGSYKRQVSIDNKYNEDDTE